MMLGKILVTGARGHLGSKLCQVFEHHGFDVQGIDVRDVDLRDGAQLKKLVSAAQPDAIIHAAAFTDVEGCEHNRGDCYAINVCGTYNLLSVASSLAAKFVFISSDYLFDGRRERGGYYECDRPHPLNVYGRSKLLGEFLVQRLMHKPLIVRSSTFYGPGHNARGFAYRALERLRRGETIRAAVDQIASPTLIDELAEALVDLLCVGAKGVWHVAGPQPVSRYGFAQLLAEGFGLDPTLVLVASADDSGLSHRPRNVSLCSYKLSTLRIYLSDVTEGIKKWRRYHEAEATAGGSRLCLPGGRARYAGPNS